jgi:hypothetical protein
MNLKKIIIIAFVLLAVYFLFFRQKDENTHCKHPYDPMSPDDDQQGDSQPTIQPDDGVMKVDRAKKSELIAESFDIK